MGAPVYQESPPPQLIGINVGPDLFRLI